MREKRRTRVYVSGPLTNGQQADEGTVQENLRRACEVGVELLRAGYAPLVPHLTAYVDPKGEIPHGEWLSVDEAWLAVADCLLALPDWQRSEGARREVETARGLRLPVYFDIDELQAAETPWRWADVEDVLLEMARLHHAKARGYGTHADPLHNIRATEEWGVPAWVGALIRGSDKVRRLQSYWQRGEWAFESARDNLLDLGVYAAIAAVLLEEERAG